MMCKNTIGSTVKCGNVWDLNDVSEIKETTVMVKVQEEEDQEMQSEEEEEVKYNEIPIEDPKELEEWCKARGVSVEYDPNEQPKKKHK